MTTINITDMRGKMRDIADEVEHHGERICVARNGRPAFALVPIEDVELLETMEEKAGIAELKNDESKGGSL